MAPAWSRACSSWLVARPSRSGHRHRALRHHTAGWDCWECSTPAPGSDRRWALRLQGRIESIGGREKDPDDYEKIRQWLGELLVVHHFVSYAWPGPVTFDPEPVAAGSQQNPEMTINAEGSRLGIEVGTPDLRELVEQRGSVDRQLLNRMPGLKDAVSGEVPLPRDNPIKDFLCSEDSTFAGFRAVDAVFRSVLAIVWDDYVDEPSARCSRPARDC